MSTTTLVTDTLPSDVPKVDIQGTNWPIFALRFEDAMYGKGLWGHFDGSAVCPDDTEDNKDAVVKWKAQEAKARSLLTQRLPDATVSKISKIDGVAKRWATISSDFLSKNAFMQASLRSEFMES
ncbi:hypothetical protein FISHEDRAFT_53192 [Fistulina hepatica ATCC 64428]|nr:hypothetical protein FISHEDRAFT_53192 [Fistulina hepatica ATCC 64428]